MSLTWNKTILGQFSLLAFNPVRSQWGHYDIPRYIMKNNNSPKRWPNSGEAEKSERWLQGQRNRRPPPCNCAVLSFCTSIIVSLRDRHHLTSFEEQHEHSEKNTEIDHFSLNKSTKSMESAHGHQLRVIHRAHPLYVWMSHPLLPPWRLRHHCPPASPDLRSRDDFNLAPKIEN